MWIQPKTDWKPNDYLNLETDFNRIEGNIHEIAEWLRAKGVTVDIDENLSWNKSSFLTVEEIDRVINNAFWLILNIPTPWIEIMQQYGFWHRPLNADGMNELETVVLKLGWVMDGIAPLMENDGKTVCDRNRTDIFCKDGGTPAGNYQSIYTGAQINEFVRQMKEWNNGTI